MTTIYQLLPHTFSPYRLDIEASIIRLSQRKLSLSFLLWGACSAYWFDRQKSAKRVDELWRGTCFEAFVKYPHHDEYWEFNIAPSGAWNVYHFEDYKKGMSEESRVFVPEVYLKREENEVKIEITFSFSEDFLEGEIVFNLAVILLDKRGERHFYTIHPQEGSPDFHDQRGWVGFS